MQLQDISDYIQLSKDAIDLLKTAYGVLPKGPDKEAFEKKIAAAEEILKRADAKLASDLGYRLCQCQFPPRPMLWKEQIKSYVCQNPECGRKIETKPINSRPVRAEYF